MPMGKREADRFEYRIRALRQIEEQIDILRKLVALHLDAEVGFRAKPLEIPYKSHGRDQDRLRDIQWAVDHYNRLLAEHGLTGKAEG